MKTQNKMLVFFVVTAALLGSMTSTINFAMAQGNNSTATTTTKTSSESVITRDSVTLLLEGKSVNHSLRKV